MDDKRVNYESTPTVWARAAGKVKSLANGETKLWLSRVSSGVTIGVLLATIVAAGSALIDVAVIKGNRFTDQDAKDMEDRIKTSITSTMPKIPPKWLEDDVKNIKANCAEDKEVFLSIHQTLNDIVLRLDRLERK